ncbi:MAG TPA: endonuclease domain-containing protein [Thiothrix sp.]|nr:endonuclease domain-containing protein [Thiothrix sp.]
MEYNKRLIPLARKLRNNMTDAEQLLWFKVRRKQIHGVLFNRQKPIGSYIVDFYSHQAALVIEIDGSQHFETHHQLYDKKRESYLTSLGLKVLRFDNLQVLHQLESVVDKIEGVVTSQISQT